MAELRPKASSRRQSKGHHSPTAYNVKCVVLGDGDVGKTSLLLAFLAGHCPEDLSPGPMDSLSEYDHLTKHPVTLTHDQAKINMTLVDTYGQEEYERFRERICGFADVYVLCFDVNRPVTFERIKHDWLPEFRRYSAPDCPFFVVGLKTDVRGKTMEADDHDPSTVVTYGDGQRGAKELGAVQYMECCSRNNTGVKRLFEKVAQAAVMNMLPADAKRSSCVLS